MAAAPTTAMAPADRVLTLPNLLSGARLLGVPLFLWLMLGPHADGWALLVLALSGFTDWADGVLARRLGQTSRLGGLLDPAADRLYILASLVALVLRSLLPWWLAVALVARDLVLGGALLRLRRAGWAPPEVHYLGKAATFCLLYAFPLLVLGDRPGALGTLAQPVAWGFTLWGASLYLWAGALYLVQARRLLTGDARTAAAPAAGA